MRQFALVVLTVALPAFMTLAMGPGCGHVPPVPPPGADSVCVQNCQALRHDTQPPHAPDVPAADAAYRKARRENEECGS